MFFQNVDAIIGPDEPIVYPEAMTSELDYELELAVIIGKAGKFFSPEEAEDYIAGYIVFNDITARDIQREEMKSGVFCLSKSIDTFVPIGPWIVTTDEIPDPHTLSMELRVNGEVRQRSHMSRMSVTVPEVISHYSAMGYSPGDIISTGTVSGVAGFSDDAASLYLKPGDVVEAEIERVGVGRLTVVEGRTGGGGAGGRDGRRPAGRRAREPWPRVSRSALCAGEAATAERPRRAVLFLSDCRGRHAQCRSGAIAGRRNTICIQFLPGRAARNLGRRDHAVPSRQSRAGARASGGGRAVFVDRW